MRPLLAVLLGLFFFLLNNLAIWSGRLYPPPGYSPAMVLRNPDTAQYVTYLQSAADRFLYPAYMMPWKTDDAFFSPLWVLIARPAKALGLKVLTGYHVCHLLLYIFAAWALLYMLDTFLTSRAQKIAFFIALFCTAPILLVGLGIAPILPIRPEIFWLGLIQFGYETADGLSRGGSSNSPTLTLATATTLLALAFLGRRIGTGNKRYTWMLAGITFVSAFFHPFEVFLIAPASMITLVFMAWRSGRWTEALPECAAVAIAAGAGIAPYAYQSSRSLMIREMPALFSWSPSSLVWVVALYGMTSILVVYFLLMRFRVHAAADIALLIWPLCNITIVFLPFIPFALHLFNGFSYVIPVLLVRILFQSAPLERLWNTWPRVVLGAAGAWCFLCLLGYSAYYRQIFRDGRSANPDLLFSTVVSADESQMIGFLRGHVSPDDLVLSPTEQAPWFATVPMHSFGSHEHLSFTYAEQAAFAEAFYKGSLPRRKVEQTLNDYGVSWVVLPVSSAAGSYFQDRAPVFRAGALRLYERPGNAMKPYPGLRVLRPDLASKKTLGQLLFRE